MKKTPNPMLVIGLTGGISMGKSTVALMLKLLGFPIHSADKAVHRLLAKGGKAVPLVAKRFGTVVKKDAIDRKKLAKLVFADAKRLKQLEKILHPLVRKEEQDFLKRAKKKKVSAAILEIPLLFETGAEKRCDFVLTVTATPHDQKSRVMKRPEMTQGKLNAILSRQMDDEERCRRADFVISTSQSLAKTKKQLLHTLDAILKA